MAAMLTPKDARILAILGDYRALTRQQLAILLGETEQGPRRSISRLGELGFAETDRRSLGSQATGRPEHIYVPSDQGAQWLIHENLFSLRDQRRSDKRKGD